MPQMGESIAEGTLSKWLKKVGDQVKRDEPIFEISTDKVDAEIPAPTSGVLAEILVTEGQTVAVQTVVARLETDVNAAISAPARRRAGAGRRRGGGPCAAPSPPRRPPRRLRQPPRSAGRGARQRRTRSRIDCEPSRRRSFVAWRPSTASRSAR